MRTKRVYRTWIYTVVISMFEAWTQDAAINHLITIFSASVNRDVAFNLGTNINLTCTNKTRADIVFIIWEIHLKNKNCKISFVYDNSGIDSCKDGKSIQKTSTGQLYLHVPNLSADDVGLYQCESAYNGGNENYNIKVAVTVPPVLSAWLEWKGNKIVALCRAERGTPVANISWSYGGSSEPAVKTQLDPDGFVTVESHLELLEDVCPEELTCIVQHRFWDQEKILVPELREENSTLLWMRVTLVIILTLAGVFLLALKTCRCSPHNTSQPKIRALDLDNNQNGRKTDDANY
ncbi:cell surface glycoprotein CD200 receptor 2-like [Poecilia latipinna]|uniref:cell surface glycoprotein CD200 receptor 2-like n=1 Tax=Poecilia latipinna TaxID=48699 RepID=UPI00072DC466|nr:PREDICTED: cell surface glycoprotein CD200 receptor 2-like [Poecilia latipinna]